MFLLDTNVVSELRKARTGRADSNVTSWAAGIPHQRLFISAITILEIEVGVLRIERKDTEQGSILRTWLERQVFSAFDGRILPVDAQVARRCARLHVPDPRSERDALIAATALVHGLKVVSRNVADFSGMIEAIIDPWQVQPGGAG